MSTPCIHAVPIVHYTMETALFVKRAFETFKPDAVAVELPETLTQSFLQAARRLPDISVVQADDLYFMCEPCDGAFEALRSCLEQGIASYCIDLDVENYPLHHDLLADPYASIHIGLEAYTQAHQKAPFNKHPLDQKRELYMARRLKELSFYHERILFVSGLFHVNSVLELTKQMHFPTLTPVKRSDVQLVTLTEESSREVMKENGWISSAYEKWREHPQNALLDRQKLIYDLYKQAAKQYQKTTGNAFAGYNVRNIMKYVRNYAHLNGQLMADLFQILTAAKGCVDHNYAYETWLLATSYSHRKNIDNLPELNLSAQEIWKYTKQIHFHLKQKKQKGLTFQKRTKNKKNSHLFPPNSFSICSYPPEDLVIENFGQFLKKKGTLLLNESTHRTIPFSSSLEDGLDMRETIRHFYEKKLYVKVNNRPPEAASSVVVIFNEDLDAQKFPWCTTWLGEHNQESDMAFYATKTTHNIVGPGISRCEYGGFMLSDPPGRLDNIWQDPDYSGSYSKAEVLLLAAIDYAIKPVIVYVAEKPPRSKIKSLANRFGKKIIYVPIGQLSAVLLNKIRVFHVLDGHDKREIAGDYIF